MEHTTPAHSQNPSVRRHPRPRPRPYPSSPSSPIHFTPSRLPLSASSSLRLPRSDTPFLTFLSSSSSSSGVKGRSGFFLHHSSRTSTLSAEAINSWLTLFRNQNQKTLYLSLALKLCLSRVEHTLALPPSLLSLPIREAIHMELEKLFLDKVIAKLGLCISIYDIRSIEGGHIFPGDGAPTYTVVFNLIMFRPFVGEIITAKLLSSDADGLRLSLGFFDDIYVPAHYLPSPHRFVAESINSQRGMWFWDYNIPEGPSYLVDDTDEIKFQVQSVSYPPIPVEQPKESKPFAPMVVTGSLDYDGLGPVSWWPGSEEVVEDK